MAEQPTGTVTLLFTDIEGSTRLLERLGPEQYRESLELHRRLLRDAFARHGGYEVDYEGDAFFIAFGRATDALAAAAESQQALAAVDWPEQQQIRVRMGIHTGEPLAAPPKYVGLDVHKAARIMAAGHGGQVLVSAATQRLCDGTARMIHLGEHRLKDLSDPEPLYQLQVPGLRDQFPALRTLGNRQTNLPTVATPFVGRASELADLGQLLERQGVRLVTVTGPGGVGKTRLALQAAADALDNFPDGVYWVPFATIRDPELAIDAVARGLGLRPDAAEPVVATVARYLGDKELLLVADNLEHLLAAAPDLANVLGAAPRIRVLATSREPLRIAGEHTYDLPPLAIPAAKGRAVVQGVDAVDLFVTRARSADSTFELTDENAAEIAEIVRQLDGLPLAIELAAARIRALPPAALLGRLTNRLAFLTAGNRDADERQRTLLATIEWSHDLLGTDEAAVFAQLGVFVGGFRLDAVEALASTFTDSDPFDAIASLLDKSLIRRRRDPDGEPRYWLLETIREYAAQRLDKRGEHDEAQLRHARWYVELAEQYQRDLGDDLPTHLQLVAADLANFRAAARWAETAKEDALLLRLSCGLADCFLVLGYAAEILRWLQTGLRRAEPGLDPALRTRALQWAADSAREQGDLTQARSYAEEAVAIAEQLDDAGLLRRSLHDLGEVAAAEGNNSDARSLYTRAIDVGNDAGLFVTSSIMNLALVELASGDHARARELTVEGLERCRRDGQPDGEAIALGNLGEIALAAGNYSESIERYSDCLQLALRLNFVALLAECFLHLAQIAASGGALAEALTVLAAAEERIDRASLSLEPLDRRAYDSTRDFLEARLDDPTRNAARAAGRALSDSDAAARALAAARAAVRKR
jgi:predicted ATPase/class 3 adenylate cyclase